MRRSAKLALRRSAAAGLLAVLLCGAVWVAGNTRAGRGWIETLTHRLSGGVVTLSGLGGSFPSNLTLERLELSDTAGPWLWAERVSLRWSPLELLRWRIIVDHLQAARVHMERTPRAGHPGGGTPWVPHVEVGRFVLDQVELGAPLSGVPVALSAQGTMQLRSLEDANGEVVAQRSGGEGVYALLLRLDPHRMDASLVVREPASGPLENILSLPGLGALSATITLAGARAAERLDAVVDAGSLHGVVRGGLDLVHSAADLEYSIAAPALEPRPDLAWNRLALDGRWRGPFRAPTAQAILEVDGLRLAGPTRLEQLRSRLEASAGEVNLKSVVTGLGIPGPRPGLFGDDEVKIDASLRLDRPTRPLELSASHRLIKLRAHVDLAAASGGQGGRMEISLPDVAPFASLAGQDVRGAASIDAGIAHAAGVDTFDMEANLGVTGGSAPWIGLAGPQTNLKLAGSLTQQSVRIDDLKLAGSGATLSLSGGAERAAGTSLKALQARFALDVADLSRFSSDMAGDLKMSGQVSGPLMALAADATIRSQLSVHGSESGAVEASVEVHGLPQPSSGAVRAHGMFDGAALNLDAALDRGADRSLRLVIRQADWKSAHADGDLTTDAEFRHSHGQLNLRVGELADFDRLLSTGVAGSVTGTFGLEPAADHALARIVLDGKNLSLGSLAGDVHVQAAGAADSVALQASAKVPRFYGAPAALTAAGTLNLAARTLTLENVSGDYRNQNYRTLAPAVVSYAGAVSVDDLKIGAQTAVFELSGQVAPALDVQATLRHAGPALVNLFIPELIAAGNLEAHARLQGSPASPEGSIALDATDVRFLDDVATGLPPAALHVQVQLAQDTAAVKGSLSGGPGSQLAVTGTAPLDSSGGLKLAIGGKLDLALANPLLEARGLHATGALNVDATVTGSPAAPEVGGGITLTAGSLRDYGRGVNLSDISAEVVGGGAGLEIKSFKAKAISGSIGMSGTIGILQHGVPVDLAIEAKNAQPIASSIITAKLDANLHVKGSALERLDVAGTVHVNRATIGIPDSLPPEVAVLDVRRRGRGAAAPAGNKLIVGLDVAIQAPQQILLQGRGLDAELGGEIKLTGTSDDPLASGGFDLQRGSFTIAGNKLSFTQGRVGFDGAGLQKKIDPTLDFTAEANVADATVTLRITGVADAPQFAFSSSPALPQDEIMARLLFGESAAQLSAIQVAEIGAALATLTGVGGSSNPLVKLQKSLGLDRLSVGANTTTSATGAQENNGAAIAAGRYVSKRVYVEAKQTTAGTSQVVVDVDLTKHLKLQTRLGNGTAAVQGTTPENDPGSGVGISYQFEY